MATRQEQRPIQRHAHARQKKPDLGIVRNHGGDGIMTDMYPVGVTSVGIKEHNPAAIQAYFKGSSRFQNKTHVRVLDFPKYQSGK